MTWQTIAIARKSIVVCNDRELLSDFRDPLNQNLEVFVRRLSRIPGTTR